MSQALTHPFPLRLTHEERTTLDRVFEVLRSKSSTGIPSRTTRTDIARMALDRGLQALLQDVCAKPTASTDGAASLPHDAVWMNGGAQAAAALLPPYEWGSVDPARDGDPILVVAGRGAFVVR